VIYSRWDPYEEVYHYYQAPTQAGDIHAPPSRSYRTTQLGAAPEDASWPVPPGARYIGSGTQAKGMVSLSGVGEDEPAAGGNKLIWWGLIAAVGVVAWRSFR